MKAIAQDWYSRYVLEFRDIKVSDRRLRGTCSSGCTRRDVAPDVWHLMTGMPYMARLAVGFRTPKVAVRGLGRWRERSRRSALACRTSGQATR